MLAPRDTHTSTPVMTTDDGSILSRGI
jgi:hypothetical protein